MTSFDELKMRLQQRAAELQITVTGVHSVVVEDGVADCLFDTVPDNGPLHFVFPLPPAIDPDDLSDFARWMAASEIGTLH